MAYSAILFDLDGTLVDTIGYWIEAYIHTLNESGVYIGKQEFIDEVYLLNTHFEDAMSLLGIDAERGKEIRNTRDRRYEEMLRTRPLWFEGAEDLLQETAKKYPTAIITASHQSYVDAMAEQIDLKSIVQTIVVSDDMKGKKKPDPYSLHLACERLGVDPKKCIYIGDQIFDIEAANNAGMTSCLYWTEFTPATAGEDADKSAESYEELSELLKLEN
tara:strand:+ start:727 stop:1377 length:651 start_codon:yes stop_codon:yes gene_type:complete